MVEATGLQIVNTIGFFTHGPRHHSQKIQAPLVVSTKEGKRAGDYDVDWPIGTRRGEVFNF